MSKLVEMPDGSTRSYNAKTVTDLKKEVSVSIGVDSDELAILGEDGKPIGNNANLPARSRVIPKPKWGGK